MQNLPEVAMVCHILGLQSIVTGLMIGLASINRSATDRGIPLSTSALNRGMIAQSQIGNAKPLIIAAP